MSSQSKKNNYREAKIEIRVNDKDLDISHLVIPFPSVNPKDWINEDLKIKSTLTENDRKLMKFILRKELRSFL